MAKWQPIDTAPKDGTWILLLHGETIPGVPLVEVASFAGGASAEELGYREFAKYGAWMIWNASDNWYLVDVAEPTHWMPLPPPPRAADAEAAAPALYAALVDARRRLAHIAATCGLPNATEACRLNVREAQTARDAIDAVLAKAVPH